MRRILFAAALSATAAFAQCGYSPTNLSLPDSSYPANTYASGTSTFSATSSITAGGGNGNFTVNGAASVTFQAGSTITLLPGFSAVGGSGSPTFQAKIQSVSQYQLTTASSPTSGGTVTASPCSSNGEYSAGTVVTLTASPMPGSGYEFVNWSDGSTTNPRSVTMSQAQSLTASFTVPPVKSLPSAGSNGFSLTGFNYFPRGHAFPRMLYDWYSNDCATSSIAQTNNGAWINCPQGSQGGPLVSTMAASDLQMLSQSGYNFVHLYLWDQDLLYNYSAALQQTYPGCKLKAPLNQILSDPGFVSWYDSTYTPNLSGLYSGPSSSPNNQFGALHDFVATASPNTWVFLELAIARVVNQMDQIWPANVPNGQGTCIPNTVALTASQQSAIAALGTGYAAWVNQFIDQVKTYSNVLVWGIQYGIPGPDGNSSHAWTIFWQNAYPAILAHLQADYPSGRPMLSVGLGLYSINGYVAGQLSPYQWGWQASQQEAWGWYQLGNQPNLAQTVPDVYALQAWTPSHTDFQNAVDCIAGVGNSACSPPPPGCANGMCSVSPSKMIVTEFGMSSSLDPVSSYFGNNLPSYADNNQPTSTSTGQSQFIENGLCMLHNLAIPGYAYFGVYDSATFWEEYAGDVGWTLSFNGYWGPISENASLGSGANKPLWNTMRNFSPAGCPSGDPPPVVALQTDSGYYAPGVPGTMWWTAADVTSLSTNEPPPSPATKYTVYSCDGGQGYPPLAGTPTSSPVGSCAFTQFQASSTSVTLAGTDGTNPGSPQDTSFVLSTPIIGGIVDTTNGQTCAVSGSACNTNNGTGPAISIGQQDILEVFGLGFNPLGGNNIELVNQANGNDITWFFAGETHNGNTVYFWEGGPTQRDTTQMNVGLDCTVTPTGAWSMIVRESASGTPSAPVTLNIVSAGGCQ